MIFCKNRQFNDNNMAWKFEFPFAGGLSELKWLLGATSMIFSGFFRFFYHFEGQRHRMFYGKNHRHYCNLTANQVCCAFRHVLSYFHNENGLTMLKLLISGRNSVFMYKLQYKLTSKMGTVDMVTTNYYITRRTSIGCKFP